MIDRRYFGVVRLAAIVFAVVVAGVLLVDYLLFAVKENGVTAKLHTEDAAVTRFTDSLLEARIPLIVKNDLSLDVTSEDLKVTLNDKEIKLGASGFKLTAGGADTLLIPVTFYRGADSTITKPVDLKISFTAGALYRSWSGRYEGKFSPASIIANTMKETAEAFSGTDKNITGEYTLEGAKMTAKLLVKNPFSYPVTLEFENKPIINTGDGKSVQSLAVPAPLKLSPKSEDEIEVGFTLKQPANTKDKSQKKTYALSGSLSITVMGRVEKRAVTVVVK